MTWCSWMRSRLVNLVVAVSLIVPMGTPSVFAFAKADQLRANSPRLNEPTERALDSELGGDTTPPGYQGGPGAAWTGDAAFRGPTVDILAQRITPTAGAQTGQVHIDAAITAGATGIIAGHSETRPGSPTPISDTDEEIHKQVLAAVEQGVRTVILAVGEEQPPMDIEADSDTARGQLAARDLILTSQLVSALEGLTAEQLSGRLIIAYEPRWAIAGSGQGRPATPAYAQQAHKAIRQILHERFGEELAKGIRIIYGGSVTKDNAASFLEQSDIDGLLVGGASSSTAKFVPIVKAAQTLAADKKARIGRTFYIGGNQKTYAVDKAPADFVTALASVDPQLVQIGIAPQLPAMTTWRTAAESVDAAREQAAAKAHQPARVAINGGAGRIGTNLLRGWLQNPRGYEIVALNDPDFALKNQGFDGVQAFARLLERTFNVSPRSQLAGTTVAAGKDPDGSYWIAVKGHRITLTDNPDPTQLPWAARNVDVVLEATGRFTERKDAEKHLQAGAKAVIITAPAKGELQTVAPGINADEIDAAQTVYSCASCTTNAVSAPLKALSNHLDIAYVMVPTTHSKTSDQPTLDRLRPEEFGKGVAAGENIAITKSGAGTDIAKLLTKLAGKVDAKAIRVPTPNGSLIPMTLEFNQPTTKDEIHRLLKEAAEGELKGIMAFEEQGPVDHQSMLGRTESSIVNGALTTVSPTGKVAVIWVWYDNEFGYANRVLDLVALIRDRKTQTSAPAPATPVPAEIEQTLVASLRGIEAVLAPAPAVPSSTASALRTIAAQMAPPTGGILAADESVGTAGKRLDMKEIKLPNTPENRQAMRRALLTTPGLKASGIDAVILDRDTLTNTVADDTPTTLIEHLKAQGIIPGLKTDEGLEDDPDAPAGSVGLKRPKDRELTKLDALLDQAVALGLGFTKYRTTVPGSGAPEANMRLNAQIQARQAQRTQAKGRVPVVEPEVTHDGSDGSPATHSLQDSYRTTTQMLAATFAALQQEGVWLDGMVLKTSMVLAGKNAPAQTPPDVVGFETLKALLKTVPKDVPAIVFLSGGQGDDQATTNLDGILRASQSRFTEARDAAVAELQTEGNAPRAAEVAALTATPWQLSYSFGRGLQQKPLKAWGGKAENIPAAQAAQLANNREVQAARQGRLQSTERYEQPIELARALANAEVTTAVRAPATPRPAHGKDSAVAIAAGTIHLRGDTGVSKGNKDEAAERIADAVAIANGVRDHYMAVEGALDVAYGELQEGGVHETGFVVNPRGLGPDQYSLWDHIEVTEGFHTNRRGSPRNTDTSNPGGTTLHAWGEGVKNHGVVPEMYAMVIAANVPLEKLPEYDANPLDPLLDAEHPDDQLLAILTRLAGDNGRALDDLEVVIMKRKREQAILEALQRIQQQHPGLVITQVSDGTVDPARLAMAGRTSGKYLVALEMGKSTEGTHNLFESAVLNRSRGGVFGMRYVSKNINHVLDDTGSVVGKDAATNQAARFRWTQKESDDLRRFRPQDAEAILAGTKLFTPADVKGDVEIAVPLLTDNPWFNLQGAQPLTDGDTVRVVTLHLSSQAAREQGADMWVEVDDVSRKSVEHIVAQAPFVEQEPAAADPAVVDHEGKLLALMKGPESRTVLVHPSISAQTPGFFIAWERALERFRQERGLKTLEDAVKLSAVKLLVVMPEGTDQTHFKQLVTAVNTASKGATQLKPEWFSVLTATPAEPVDVAIGPSVWLQTLSNATVKVALDAPAEEGKVVSAAGAFYSAIEAVAAGGKADPKVLAKLDVLDQDGVLVPAKVDIDADIRGDVQSYQQTVHEVGGGV